VLKKHYDTVECSRVAAQQTALADYTNFMEGLVALDLSGAHGTRCAPPPRRTGRRLESSIPSLH
jgi:hypothetical protein